MPKFEKIELFFVATKYSFTTSRVQNSLEIALSLTVSEIFRDFLFSTEIKDGRQKL